MLIFWIKEQCFTSFDHQNDFVSSQLLTDNIVLGFKRWNTGEEKGTRGSQIDAVEKLEETGLQKSKKMITTAPRS